MIGLLLIGAGSVPTHSFVPTYIDENLPKNDVPMYHAIFFGAGIIGPALGFLLGGELLKKHTDFDRLEGPSTPLELTEDSPIWVGAWWPGMFYCGCVLCGISFLIMILPRRFAINGTSRLQKSLQNQLSSGTNVTGATGPIGNHGVTVHATMSNASHTTTSPQVFPETLNSTLAVQDQFAQSNSLMFTIKHLFTNKVWILTSIAVSCDAWAIQICSAFITKYMAVVFNLTQSEAAMTSGVVLVISAMAGYGCAGAWLSSRKISSLDLKLDFSSIQNSLTLQNHNHHGGSLHGSTSAHANLHNAASNTTSTLSHVNTNGSVSGAGPAGGLPKPKTKNQEEIERKRRLVDLSFSTVVGPTISFFFSFAFLIHCDNTNYFGVDYTLQNNNLNFSSNEFLQSSTKFCSDEKTACGTCDLSNFIPICDNKTKVSYFSPCLAGCSNEEFESCYCVDLMVPVETFNGLNNISSKNNDNNRQTNKNTQIYFNHTNPTPNSLIPGPCNTCPRYKFLLFSFLIGVCMFGVFWNIVPTTNIFICGVDFSQRSQSLAFQSVITRVMGSIPGPIGVWGVCVDARIEQVEFLLFINPRVYMRLSMVLYNSTLQALLTISDYLFSLFWQVIFY